MNVRKVRPLDVSQHVLYGLYEISTDESLKEVDELSSFFLTPDPHHAPRYLTAWVEDMALIRECASAAWSTLPFTCCRCVVNCYMHGNERILWLVYELRLFLKTSASV